MASLLLKGADVALCVGIDDYEESYVPADRWLSGCASDAGDFSDFLVSRGGWRQTGILKLTDAEATGDAVLAALTAMAESAVPGDRVVYYHSSHGYVNERGVVCLCAHDRNLTGEEVSAALAGFADGVCPLVVLDACHSGGFFSGCDFTGRFAWMSSAAVGENAVEADGGGGVFTKAFVDFLRTGVCDLPENGGDGNGVCTAYEAWMSVSSRLSWWGMTPQCGNVSTCASLDMCVCPAIAAVSPDSTWFCTQNFQTSVQDWDSAFGSWSKLGDLNGVGWYFELDEDGYASRARSVPLLDYQRAIMEMDIQGDGRISFDCGVSSEDAHDFLTFSIDGEIVASISGIVDRKALSFEIAGSGMHRIDWTYAKDELGTASNDCGYVWGVSFVPADKADKLQKIVPTGNFTAAKATVLCGVLFRDGAAVGVLQVKVGKASKKGLSKVSATLTGVDGKKYTAKAVNVPVGGTPNVALEVKKLGTLTLILGENGFSGSLNGAVATSVDGRSATTDGGATFVATDLSSLTGVLTEHLPQGELVTRTEKRWKVVAKAGKLKYAKPNAKKNIAGGLQATGTNIAGLKLAYAPKTQTFKGSFKVWTFDETKKKLKSVSAKVTGIVVNGEGYGEVTVRKAKVGSFFVR